MALAVLGLLSEITAERPLVCVIDDQQWLDQASAQALGFAARRRAADPVGLVFAARVPGEELAGRLDTRVRDQIVAEAGGNPLALLELPSGRPREKPLPEPWTSGRSRAVDLSFSWAPRRGQ